MNKELQSTGFKITGKRSEEFDSAINFFMTLYYDMADKTEGEDLPVSSHIFADKKSKVPFAIVIGPVPEMLKKANTAVASCLIRTMKYVKTIQEDDE